MALNRGKDTPEYQAATGFVQLSAPDAAALGVADGAPVRLASAWGEVTVPCQVRPPADLPPGTAFMAFGTYASRLMGGETHATGMPDAKGLPVAVQPAGRPADGGEAR